MKMYVLVRNDLSASYKFVQGAHALAKFAFVLPDTFKEWGNRTIVFLSVRNLKELRVIENNLSITSINFCSFREEDLDDQLTSIACYCDGEIFKNFKVA